MSLSALVIFFLGPFLIFFVEFKPLFILLFLFHFVWFGLSSSLLYHRTITHRGAELNPILETFFLLGGVISLSGSPIVWAAVHRFHHKVPDQDEDPHSPLHGRFWAYMGWVYHQDLKLIEELKEKNSKDLLENKLYRFFDTIPMIVLPNTIYLIGLYYFFGLGAVTYGFILAGFFSYNCHWMLIASFCHHSSWGYRRFNTKDESRNVPWLSLLSFGESLHNNHHQNQRSFKLKSSLNEFDFSYFMVKVFEKIGLAKNIIEVDFRKKDAPFE